MPDQRRRCAWCDLLFAAADGRQRYCSPDCRGRARKARRRAERAIQVVEFPPSSGVCVKVPYKSQRAAKTAGRAANRQLLKARAQRRSRRPVTIVGVHECKDGCPPGTWHTTSKKAEISL